VQPAVPAVTHGSGQPPRPSPRPAQPPGQNVEVVEPARLVDTSADELLEEIRRKRHVIGLLPLTLVTSAVGFVVFLVLLQSDGAGLGKWAMLTVTILALAVSPWAGWRDRKARLVRVQYVFDPLGSKVQEAVTRLVGALGRAHTIWGVNHQHVHGDWKRNAGAGTSVTRRRVHVGWGNPSFVETNARIGVLSVDDTNLYFFPDRVLIFDRSGVHAVPYAELDVQAGTVHFREEGGIPRDAKVIGRTWRYVNKSGAPDRRFNNNYQIPIVLYGTLEVSAPSGLRLSLQTSSDTAAIEAVAGLRELKASVQELERRRGSTPPPDSLPGFPQEKPPVSLPSLKAIKPLGNLATFRWFDRLPGWASPIAWGLLSALPLVALMIWFSTRNMTTAIFLCASCTLAGGGVGRLVYEVLHRGREARMEKASASRSRFRAVLANELRVRPLEVVRFSELVAESDIAREDADRIADELLLRVMVKFLADGILSDRESAKLDALAGALEVDAARLKRLEGEAKSERYRQAVSDALADGTVTAEETQMLNDLRDRFGMGGSKWTADDLVPRG
jgi:hypothetical protein